MSFTFPEEMPTERETVSRPSTYLPKYEDSTLPTTVSNMMKREREREREKGERERSGERRFTERGLEKSA